MFSDLLRRLTAPEPQTLPDTDARVALGALLVRLARTDGDYAASEVLQIDQVLMQRYGLDHAGAQALRAQCTRAIKDAIPYPERLGVIEAMWAVVLADGVRDDEEDSLMRMVAPLLGISDQDSHRARLRVSAG